jgi:hypothetical protein
VRSIWDTLGIEATVDLVAIKRAYAARLKTTRPDDDAGAYQQLREAYEWAQQHARWQREQAQEETAHHDQAVDHVPVASAQAATEPPVAKAADAPPVRSEVIDPVAAPDRAVPVHDAVHTPDQIPDYVPKEAEPDWIHPQALASSLLDHWRTQGDDALLQAWPALTQHLDNVPLSLRSESSVWFAELVLQHDQLPRDFIENLARYFAWGQDYRVEQILGFERAEKLRTLLTSDHIRPIRDEATLKQYEDLFTLDRLWSKAQRTGKPEYKAYLFAFLAHPYLGERAQGTPPRMLRALGFEPTAFAGLLQATKVSMWLRIAFMVLLLSAIEPDRGMLVKESWGMRTILLGLLAFMGAVLMGFLANCVAAAQGGWNDTNPLYRWFEQHRDRKALLAGSAVSFALAWAVATIAWSNAGSDWIYRYPWAFGSWILLMISGIVSAWPRGRPSEFLILPLAVITYFAVSAAMVNLGGKLAAAAVTGLWLMGAHAALVFKSDYLLIAYRQPWNIWRPTAWWGWLLWLIAFKAVAAIIAFVVVITMPLTFMVLSVFYGVRLPLAAIGLAFAMAMLGFVKPGDLWVLGPLSFLFALALVALQSVGTTLSRLSWFRSEPIS